MAHDTASFAFFLKIVLAIQDILFPYKFGIISSTSVKNAIGILIGIAWTLDCLGEHGHFNNIDSSNP